MDINLTWPQTGGKIPQINLNDTTGFPIGQNGTDSAVPGLLNPQLQRSNGVSSRGLSVKSVLQIVDYQEELAKRSTGKLAARKLKERDMWVRDWVASKRDLSGRANGTIDPYYGCFLMDELQDYALNFSLPWSAFLFFSTSQILEKRLTF